MISQTTHKEAERLHDAMCSWISAKLPRSHTVHAIEEALHAIEEALTAAYERGKQEANRRGCGMGCWLSGGSE